MAIPTTHIDDAHKLTADAEIDLYQLVPSGGGGTVYFKNDNDVTWQGNTYTGIPLQFSGESFNADGNMQQPSLVIGQPNIDLSAFKPLIYDGTLDGAKITRHTVLLDHIIANTNIKNTRIYRVKRVDNYSINNISLVLATFSVGGPATIPFRQYLPPAFPFVRL